jgi:hypothetical protein
MIVYNELRNLVRLGDYIEVYDKKCRLKRDLQFCGINKDKTLCLQLGTNELDSSV